MSAHRDTLGGAPEEFPPSYAEFEVRRARYLEERRRDAEEHCGQKLLRELITELTRSGRLSDVEM